MSDVPCNGCTACCKAPIVLHPMAGDDPSDFNCTFVEGAGYVLDSLEDGSCIYVSNTGCSIWERRPAACRMADCRVLAKMDWAQLDPLRDDAVIRQGLNLLYDEVKV